MEKERSGMKSWQMCAKKVLNFLATGGGGGPSNHCKSRDRSTAVPALQPSDHSVAAAGVFQIVAAVAKVGRQIVAR